MRGGAIVVGLGVALAWSWFSPASADAATVHATQDSSAPCICVFTTVTVTGVPGEGNHMTVSWVPDPLEVVLNQLPFPLERPHNFGTYVITDTAPLTVSGQGCTLRNPNLVTCAAGGGISGNLGDRNDTLEAEVNAVFSGGTGDDRLTNHAGGVFTGADGNDSLQGPGEIRGGNGNDNLTGPGPIFCGAGADVAVGRRAAADCETVVGTRG